VKTFVLDTSVAVAWYLPEDFAAAARPFRDRLLAGTTHLVVPGLHYWEFGNVLRTYVRRREIDSDLAEEIYSVHLDAPLEIVEPDRRRVLTTAVEYEATVYDAVYVSLALEQDVPLLTAERTTTPWVVRLAGRVHSLRRA
jgi:predicted nucleic acid-binding protein